MWLLKSYLLTLAVISLLTFAVFAADKSRAARGLPRVPESVLLTLMGLGGGVGGLLGMYVLRHKTNGRTKFHFAGTVFLAMAVQTVLGVFLYYAGRGDVGA